MNGAKYMRVLPESPRSLFERSCCISSRFVQLCSDSSTWSFVWPMRPANCHFDWNFRQVRRHQMFSLRFPWTNWSHSRWSYSGQQLPDSRNPSSADVERWSARSSGRSIFSNCSDACVAVSDHHYSIWWSSNQYPRLWLSHVARVAHELIPVAAVVVVVVVVVLSAPIAAFPLKMRFERKCIRINSIEWKCEFLYWWSPWIHHCRLHQHQHCSNLDHIGRISMMNFPLAHFYKMASSRHFGECSRLTGKKSYDRMQSRWQLCRKSVEKMPIELCFTQR